MGKQLAYDVVKKSVTLNQEELARVKAILGARTDSEALRQLIRERLAVEGALQAHRRIARGRAIVPVLWR